VTSRSWSIPPGTGTDLAAGLAAGLGKPHLSTAVTAGGVITNTFNIECARAHEPGPCPAIQPLAALRGNDVIERIEEATDPFERAQRAHHAISKTLPFFYELSAIRSKAVEAERERPGGRTYAEMARELDPPVSPQALSHLVRRTRTTSDEDLITTEPGN